MYMTVTLSHETDSYSSRPEACLIPDINSDVIYKQIKTLISSNNKSAWLPIRKYNLSEWMWTDGRKYGKNRLKGGLDMFPLEILPKFKMLQLFCRSIDL